MQPLEKAVAKTLKAKQKAIDDSGRPEPVVAVVEKRLPEGEQIAPNQTPETEPRPPQPVKETHDTNLALTDTELKVDDFDERSEDTGEEQARRERARRQLFPNKQSRAQPTSAATKPATEATPKSGEASAQNDASDLAQRGPDGSLARIDASKLDELVSARLGQNSGAPGVVREEHGADTLNGLRMLDREFKNWETALRSGNQLDARKSQQRVEELLLHIPEPMAKGFRPTLKLLSGQTNEHPESANKPSGAENSASSDQEAGGNGASQAGEKSPVPKGPTKRRKRR